MKFGIIIADIYIIIWGFNMFQRYLNFDDVLKRKSLFLFGPRQTGKSTYLKTKYKNAHIFNLLKPAEFLRFKTQPAVFGEEVLFLIQNKKVNLFIVDEIQKIPELLDEVHNLIEEHKSIRFILTGSSARKLKKAGVNLLGGRASRIHFHPITSIEYGFKAYEVDLIKNLTYGFLPSILTSSDPWADLEDYVTLYLKEEIQQEAIIRNLDGFSRFLNSVAMTNSQQLNFTQIGNDAQVPPRTVREYYQVLEDTLIGNILPPYEKTIKRKAVSTAKFYLFDPGITNFLLGRKSVSKKSTEFGELFEQAIFCELKAYFDYQKHNQCLFYWRSSSKFEVDFLVRTKADDWIAIEVKSSSNPSERDYRGIMALEEELALKRKFVVCFTPQPRKTQAGIEILPFRIFLEILWNNELL
jgi:predicted AAA+ superfamily ATPase